jgi:hypothetical protein
MKMPPRFSLSGRVFIDQDSELAEAASPHTGLVVSLAATRIRWHVGVEMAAQIALTPVLTALRLTLQVTVVTVGADTIALHPVIAVGAGLTGAMDQGTTAVGAVDSDLAVLAESFLFECDLLCLDLCGGYLDLGFDISRI